MFAFAGHVFNIQCWLMLLIILTTWILTKRRKWIYIIHKTWRRDLRGLITAVTALLKMVGNEWRQDTVPKIFMKVVKKYPDRVAFYFENEVWTFQQVEDYSNRVANYFIAEGYQKGDTVALLLENRPEYFAIWLGLSKIGVAVSLINTNLVSKSLLHCIVVVNAKAFIFGSDFISAVRSIEPNLSNIKLLQFNTSLCEERISNSLDFKDCLENQATTLPFLYLNKLNGLKMTDKVLYVFTSGTTGLPKAAIVNHKRINFMACSMTTVLGLTQDDIFYNPLPLYHASGGIMSLGACLFFGVPIAIRKKFSASNFWSDCIKYKCTASNYIGETCRYILEAHKGQKNIKHSVKKMYGNGLKKEVWKEFIKAFNYPQIFEGYGSTEGNVNVINLDGTIGACGFVPLILSMASPMIIIKYDEETNEPIKDANGYCIRCKDGEPGLLIGKIHKKLAAYNFEGYADNRETNNKILRNVFKNGDEYFNTGDLLVKDELNYLYFKDRIGDTYRWKGENVATTEVEFIASEAIGPKDIVVYGVQVANNEGKAGMVGIVDKENPINTKELAKGFKANLPAYAIPLFVRHLQAMPLTTTFKVKKMELQREGFNINLIEDPLFVFDSMLVDYIPLDEKIYVDIMSGKRKL